MKETLTTANLKILILVLSSKHIHQAEIKKPLNTWGSILQDDLKIIFYESGEVEKVIDDTLFVGTDTSSKNLGYKLTSFNWCEQLTMILYLEPIQVLFVNKRNLKIIFQII